MSPDTLADDVIVLAVKTALNDHNQSGDGDRDEELIDYLYTLFDIEEL